MVGHSVPGIIRFQNLHRHLALLQQFTDKDRDQILCFQRIARDFFLKELFEALFQYIQKIRCQSPHIHGYQRIYINSHTICLCSSFSLDDVLGFHNLGQIILVVHLADTTGHATVVRQSILQHKACHTGLASIHQILMDSLEAFLAIVIICIDDNERSINHIFRCKDGLTGSPRLCTAFRKFSRNIVNVLESVIHSYIMRRTNGGNAIADDLFELFLDILANDKDHVVKASFDRIMDGIVHDNVIRSIYWLQLLDSRSEAAANTSCHNK